MRRHRILTWHVHGNYLHYLTQGPHEFFVLSKPGRPAGYGGRCGVLPWGANVHDCPVETLPGRRFDAVLFQSRAHWNERHEVLSAEQLALPTVFLEHDPPLEHPTNTRHPVDDPSVTIVHCTHYNALMWDCGPNPTRVVEHGVLVPDGIAYSGELARAVTSINHITRRGRRLGSDLYERWRTRVPLDLYGMGAEEAGGIGELPYRELMRTLARYRVYVHPVRYTSLALAVCEAMTIGLPVVGLATTELPRIVRDGESGFIDSDVERLIERTRALLDDPPEAARMGESARRFARERFAIGRFVADWNGVFDDVIAS
jgi:hypothetical protein